MMIASDILRFVHLTLCRFHPYTYARHQRAFSDLNGKEVSPVTLWSKAGIIFVFANSMAFHGDNCRICSYAEYALEVVSTRLKCMRGELSFENCQANNDDYNHFIMEKGSDRIQPGTYSRPILVTHFPLYRPNETVCEPGLQDSMPDKYRDEAFKPDIDCLSQSATKRVREPFQLYVLH